MTLTNHLLDMATAPKRDSRHWAQETITWGDLVAWLATPARNKACGNYMLGRLQRTTVRHKGANGKPGDPCLDYHRTKLAVEHRGAITLDVDHAETSFLADAAMLLECAAIIHTTYSSTPEEPRYRVIVPLSRTVTPDEYHVAAGALMQLLGEKQFDPGSVQPERYMFKPSASKAANWQHLVLDGPLADVDVLLDSFTTDLSSIPAPKPARSKRDPFAIEGTIGAFNRAYERFEDVIAEYQLPYEEAGADRWHLQGATAAAGMSKVGDGLVFSHHANDPAYGQACSAFDLVRLHLYGHLDEDAAPGTPVNRLPSNTAMLEHATEDVRVVTELVGADFSQELSATADAIVNDNWKLGFRLNSRTGEPNDDIVNWDLIVDNDEAFAGLYYNELSLSIETDRALPWRPLAPGREVFDAGDRSSLALYIERTYHIRPPRSYMDDLINDKARNRRVNPVLDYLNSLRWDGVSRIETALPGVRPTAFTRLAARKSLVAAVARMYDPGVKWDHMLVLFGPEGRGKSAWVDRMSKGYSASLGRLQDKDTLITMQRSWIMTSDEGHSLRKADFDAQKEFITRTADVFRLPYEREAQVHKRHCVIWGTTNDEVFLRRQEGNRRFLIVHCEDKMDFDTMTDAYVDQVWAEAVHLYRAGEKLWLDDDEGALAAVHREPFTEEDALAGIIHEYLDTMVPADWADMAPADRQLWLMNRTDGFTAVGTERINEVCSVQIWVEALGRRYGDHKRVDLLEINAALKQLPGWAPLPGRRRISGYGPQLVFHRVQAVPGHELL